MLVASLEPIGQCKNIVFWAQPRSCCGMFRNWKVPFPFSGLLVPGLDFALTSVLNFLFSLPVLQQNIKEIFLFPPFVFGSLYLQTTQPLLIHLQLSPGSLFLLHCFDFSSSPPRPCAWVPPASHNLSLFLALSRTCFAEKSFIFH